MDHDAFKAEISRIIKKPLSIKNCKLGTTPLEDIAWLYFSTATKDLKDLAKEEINSNDFPRNLLIDVIEMPNPYFRDKRYESSLTEYPKLVRQAGHFG